MRILSRFLLALSLAGLCVQPAYAQLGAVRAVANSAFLQAVGAKAAAEMRHRDRIVVVGDSIVSTYAYSTSIGQAGGTRRSSSPLAWFQALSGNQFDLQAAYDLAVPSTTTTDMLAVARSAAFSAIKAGKLLYMGGTNDAVNGIAPDTTIANDRAIIQIARNLGMDVFIGTIAPRIGGSWSSNTAGEQAQFIKWQRQVNYRRQALAKSLPGVHLIDLDSTLNDGAGAPITTRVRADGVHPSDGEGGYYWGLAIWNGFQAAGYGYEPDIRNDGLTTASNYSATDNPYGNRLTNPTFQGASGTVSSGAAGTVPTSWQASAGSGLTATGSQVARGDGVPGTVQRFVITSSGAGASTTSVVLQNTVTIAPTVGSGIVGKVALKVASGAVNLNGVQLRLRLNGGGGSSYCFEVLGPLPSGWQGVLSTDQLIVPAGTTSVDFMVSIFLPANSASNTVTVDISDGFLGAPPPATDLN